MFAKKLGLTGRVFLMAAMFFICGNGVCRSKPKVDLTGGFFGFHEQGGESEAGGQCGGYGYYYVVWQSVGSFSLWDSDLDVEGYQSNFTMQIVTGDGNYGNPVGTETCDYVKEVLSSEACPGEDYLPTADQWGGGGTYELYADGHFYDKCWCKFPQEDICYFEPVKSDWTDYSWVVRDTAQQWVVHDVNYGETNCNQDYIEVYLDAEALRLSDTPAGSNY